MTAGARSARNIEPTSREVAEDLARKSGMTLNEWVANLLAGGGEAPAAEASPNGPALISDLRARVADRLSGSGRSAEEVVRVTEAIERLSDRIESAESRQALAIAGVERSVREVIARIDAGERDQMQTAARVDDDIASARSETSRITDRVRRIEDQAAGPRSAEALRALEGVIGKVAGQINEGDRRTRETLADIKGRVDRLDGAEAATATAIRDLKSSCSALDERLSLVDRIGAQGVEHVAETLSARVASVREELGRQIAEAADARFDRVDLALAKMSEHVRAAEQRSAMAIERMGREVLEVAQNLNRRVQTVETRTAEATGRMSADMSRIASAVEARLIRTDSIQAQALEKLGGEIARITERLADRISNSERRSAEAIDLLGDQVTQVSVQITERQERSATELSERIRQSEERTARLLEAARLKLDGRLAETQRRTVEVVASHIAARADKADDTLYLDAPIPAFEPLRAMPLPIPEPAPVAGARAFEDADFEAAAALEPSAIDAAFAHEPGVVEATLADEAAIDPTPETGSAPIAMAEAAPIEALFAPEAEVEALELEDLEIVAPGVGSLDAADAATIEAEHEAAVTATYESIPTITDALTESEAIAEPETDSPATLEAETPYFVAYAAATFEAADDELFEAAAPTELSTAPDIEDGGLIELEAVADAELETVALEPNIGFDADELPSERSASTAVTDEDFDDFAEPAPALTTRDIIERARAAARAAQDRGKRPLSPANESVLEHLTFGRGRHRNGSGALMVASLLAAVGLAGGGYLVVDSQDGGKVSKSVSNSVSDALAFAGVKPASSTSGTPMAAIALAPKPDTAAPTADATADYSAAVAKIAAGRQAGLADLKQLAGGGYAPAQFYLAELYQDGKAGLAKDPAQSRHWLERAAQGGDRTAMHNLALDEHDGVGGPRDAAGAAEWFRRAAELGLLDSQYNLAALYEHGDGVGQNPAEAYKWYLIAARAGDVGAKAGALRVRAGLNADARAVAERAAAGFQPNTAAPAPAPSVSAPAPAAVFGDLVAAQKALNQLGYYQGPTDGAASPAIHLALAAYQRDQGLPITGAPDAVTLGKLSATAQ